MEVNKGRFYGVGVGPGDPELLTLKAVRILEQCPVLAAPRTKGGETLALDIAKGAVSLDGKELLLLRFTMDRDPAVREASYRAAAEQIEAQLSRGRDVAMVNLGDVSVYATYGYLARRIRAKGYETVMVPGVTSFSAVAARLGVSLTTMDAPLHIVPASAMAADEALALPGTKVLMKAGSQIGAVRQALEQRGLLDKAALVANCGLENEVVCTDLSQFPEGLGYYTTMIVKE